MPKTARSPQRHREARAVGYARRSTDKQEQSIPDQQRAIERYCKEQGLTLTRWFIDDAISGTKATNRPAFQEMVAASGSPGCDFGLIVVYDVKRFGRLDNDEAGYYRHILKQAGVEVLYVAEGFAAFGESCDTDDLLRPVKQWQARQESKDLSKVTIRGQVTKAETGCWMGGVPPLGYDLRYETESGDFLFIQRFMPDGSKQMLDSRGGLTRTLARGERVTISKRDRCRLVSSEPSRVETTRRIFRMAAEEHKGFRAIANTLNDDGVPTPRGPAWSRIYSGEWSSSTIRAILVNPLYVGDMIWNRRTDARFHKISDRRAVERRDAYGARLEPNEREDWIVVPDTHEPLIERRLFELARRARESRETSRSQRGCNTRRGGWRGQRARYLLSGLAQCSKCGSRYEGYRRQKGKARVDGSTVFTYSYGCGGYIRKGRAVCRMGPIPQEQLEQAVIEAIVGGYARYRGRGGRRTLAEAVRSLVGSESEDLSGARERAEVERKDIKATIANLLDNITPTNRDAVDERIRELTKERDTVERRLDELGHLALSATSIEAVVKETSRFLDGLEFELRSDNPEARITALRRCVESITVDAEAGAASIRIWSVPNATLQSNAAIEVACKLESAVPAKTTAGPERGPQVSRTVNSGAGFEPATSGL